MPPRITRFPSLGLNPRLAAPVYLQIFRQVQRLASTGRLRSGDRLPTVRELAVHLGVNFNTVARAYRLLQRAGVVMAQPGRGTFVLDRDSIGAGSQVTLRAITASFIAEATRRDFSAAQIEAMVRRLLRASPGRARAGDSHG